MPALQLPECPPEQQEGHQHRPRHQHQQRHPPSAQSFATPKGQSSSSGEVPSLKELVIRAKEEGVSDLHLGVNEFPRFRTRGEIADIGYPQSDLDTFFGWLRECMSDEEIEIFQKNLDFDGAFDFGFVRIRISCMDSLAGPAMVLRLIPAKILTMEELKLPDVFKKICGYHKGLILVTGPTGSGKSTTLAADRLINKNQAYNISRSRPGKSYTKSKILVAPEVGSTRSFMTSQSARRKTGMLLVGEIRDRDVEIASKISNRSLVEGTRTPTCGSDPNRILDCSGAEEQDAAVSISNPIGDYCSTAWANHRRDAGFPRVMINTVLLRNTFGSAK